MAINLDHPVDTITPSTGTLNIAGATTFPAGTVSLPAITTTGDTNTGIFFPAADTIAFTEGGAESMRINSSGQVGIGTSSPDGKLDIATGGATDVVAALGGTFPAFTYRNGSGAWFHAGKHPSSDYFYIGNGGTPTSTISMVVDANSLVGIGTTSPATYNGLLNVKGADRAVIGYFGGTTYATRLGANASTATIESVDAATGVSSYQPLQVGGSIVTLATGGSERMRIFASGGVSIGNTTDAGATNLSVTGNVTAPNLQGPAFSAYLAAAQSISNATYTKVTFDTETFDTNSNFASSTFTPTKAGYYQVNCGVSLTITLGNCAVFIYKNGTAIANGGQVMGASQIGGFVSLAGSCLVYCNGSTDYLEVYAYQAAGGAINTNTGVSNVYFNGSMVRS
jgi:hypothetical protein